MPQRKIKKIIKQSKQKPKVPTHKPRRGKYPIHEDSTDELFHFFLKSSNRLSVDERLGNAWENLDIHARIRLYDRLFEWTLAQPTISLDFPSTNAKLLFLTPQPEVENVEIEENLRKKRAFKRLHPSLLPLYQFIKFNLQYEGENEGHIWLSFKQRIQRHTEETLSIHMLKKICTHVTDWIPSPSDMDTENGGTQSVVITLVEIVCQLLNNLVPSRKSSPYEMPFQSFSDPDDIGMSSEHRSIAITTLSIILNSSSTPKEVKQLIFEMLSTNILKMSMSIPLKSTIVNGIINICQAAQRIPGEEDLMDMQTVKLLRTTLRHLEGEGNVAQFATPIRPPIHINYLRATPENDEDETLFPLLLAMLSDSIEWIRSGISHQDESVYITERVRVIQSMAYIVTYKSFRNFPRTEITLPLLLDLLDACSPYDWPPFHRTPIRISEFIGYLVILGPLETSPFSTVLSSIPGVNFTGDPNANLPPTSEAFKTTKKTVKTKIEQLVKKARDLSDPNAAHQAAKCAIALLGTHLVVEPSIFKTYFPFIMDSMEDPSPAMKVLCLWCLHQSIDTPPIISRSSNNPALPQPDPLPTVAGTDLRVVMETYMQQLDSSDPNVMMVVASALNSPNLIMTLTLSQKDFLATAITKFMQVVLNKLEMICFGGTVDDANWRCFQLTLDSLASVIGVWSTCPLPPISTLLGGQQLEKFIMFVIELIAKTNSNREAIMAGLKALTQPKTEKSNKRRTATSRRAAGEEIHNNNTAKGKCLVPVTSKVISLREYCARSVIKSDLDTSALPGELHEYIEQIKKGNEKLSHEIQVTSLHLFRALCISGFQDTVAEHKCLTPESAEKIITTFSLMDVPQRMLLATARAVDRLVIRLPPKLEDSQVSKLLPLLLNPLTTQMSSIEATEQLQFQILSEVFTELLLSHSNCVSTICEPVIQFLWEFVRNPNNQPSMKYTATELLKGMLLEDQPWYMSVLITKLRQAWMTTFASLLADWNNSQYDYNKKNILDECMDNLSEMFEFLFEDKEWLFKTLFKKQFPTSDRAQVVFDELLMNGNEPDMRKMIHACGMNPSNKRKRQSLREGAIYSKVEPNKDEEEDEDDFFFPPFGPMGLFGFPGLGPYHSDESDLSDSDGLHVDYGVPTCFHNHPHEYEEDDDDSDSDGFSDLFHLV